MKTVILSVMLGFLSSVMLVAQISVPADSGKWTAYHGKAVYSGDSIHVINTSNKTALLWANGIRFKNGVIELDIKGCKPNGESFVGVAFSGINNDSYEAIYFRPANFRSRDKKDYAVQYIHLPDGDWDLLREKHPGKYEHAIVPDIDPTSWFHVKMIIQHPAISVFVNGSIQPTLKFDRIGKEQNGMVGLWVDSEEGWFRNVRITNKVVK